MAIASQWVARIIAAGALMVLPGIAGDWVDDALGTSFFALCGFGLGIAGSLCYLVAVTKNPPASVRSKKRTDDSEHPGGENSGGERPQE